MRWNRAIRKDVWTLLPLVLFLQDGGKGPHRVPPAAERQSIIGRRQSPAPRDARITGNSRNRHLPPSFVSPGGPESSDRPDPPPSPAPEPVLAPETIPPPVLRSRQEEVETFLEPVFASPTTPAQPDGYTMTFPDSLEGLTPDPAPLPELRGARLSSRPKREDSRPPAAKQTPPIIRIHPSSSTVQVGGTLTVEVTLEGGREVQSIPFHLRYPGELLEYLHGEIGTFLGTNNDESLFMTGGPPGELFIALTKLPGTEPVSGSGSLCRLNFRAIAPGSALLAFEDAHLFGPGLAEIDAEFLPAGVDLLPSGPDHAPALPVTPLVTGEHPR